VVIKSYGKTLLQSYSYLLFSDTPIIGVILLILSFVNPSAGVHALVAFSSALLFSRLSRTNSDTRESTLFFYNSLLSGLAIGYLFKISMISILFTMAGGILAFLVSYSFYASLTGLFRLPILNVPFAVVAIITYLAAIHYSSMSVANRSSEIAFLSISGLPLELKGLFSSLGTLLFLPYDIVGLILLIMIFINSRINFILIIAGYFTGTFFHGLLSGVPTSGYYDFYSFNYILIALALGGFYLIPSKRSYLIMISGVAVGTVILDAMTVLGALFNVPPFTLPFALTVLLFLHTLSVSRYPYVTRFFKRTPEESLELWCSFKERFSSILPAPRLPFSGEWSVYQGFEDEWTHQGLWRYAVDFVIEDKVHGTTYKGSGKRLEDYYCYKKPVLSPVIGTVAAIQNSIPDNHIAEVDKENNWGNYIVIYSDYGYYIELSHFAKDSITVVVGERVVAGQIIGKCGNSGYSPQPHIHMQVQNEAHVGAPAAMFTFSQTVANGSLIRQEFTPKKGDRLTPLIISKKISSAMQFILDDQLQFTVLKNGIAQETLNLVVRMELDGTYFLEDQKLRSKLYFKQTENEFTFTSFSGKQNSSLRLLFIALPSLPISESKVCWNDSLPGSLLMKRYPFFASVLKSFHHKTYSGKGKFSIDGMTITGETKLRKLTETTMIKSSITLANGVRFKDVRVEMEGVNYELAAQ